MDLEFLSFFRRRPSVKVSEEVFNTTVMVYAVDDLSPGEERAHHAGDLALMHAAMSELARLAPSSPLLLTDVARSIYELGVNTYHDSGWAAAEQLVADPQAVLVEQSLDFEGRRQSLLKAVASSPIEKKSIPFLMIFRKRTVTWRGRAYPTERAAKAAKNSELRRLRGASLGDSLEPGP